MSGGVGDTMGHLETGTPSPSGEEKPSSQQADDVPKPEEMLTKTTGRRWGWAVLSLCLLVSGLVLTSSGLASWSLNTRPADRYLVLLDAGSVHTSVYTYRYSYSEPSSVDVNETYSCDLDETGISDYQDNPEEAAKMVSGSDCVLTSLEKIPEEMRAQSRLELLSTAGMRMVRLKDPVVAAQILGNLSHQLDLLGQLEASTDILTGVEEGVAGWVTSLQLSGEPVGALDWGGASSQVTVPDAAGQQEVSIGGEQFTVSSSSHLCYGQAESLKRHRAGLVLSSRQLNLGSRLTVNITEPCLPDGASTDPAPLALLFSSPCTWLADPELGRAMAVSPAMVRFVSGPDYGECSRLIQDQFSPENCSVTWQPLPGEATCLDPDTFPPPANLTYLAMSTYWYLSNGLEMTDRNLSLAEYQDLTSQVCSLQISDPALVKIEAKYPGTSKKACYQSLMMYHLLTTGYHFNSTSWPRIKFVKRIANTEVGWGLGHATIQANNVQGNHYVSLTGMIVLVVIGLLFILLSVSAAVKGLVRREVYTRLREMI